MGNLAASLKYLKDNRVKKGDSVESAARSDRMNALTDAILSLARGEHMRKGPGIRLKTSEGVVIISGSPEGEGGGGGTDLAFELTLTTREDDPEEYAIQIRDGKVNNEWPDVGDTAMGQTDGPGYGQLDIGNIANSNVFIRVMFNAQTLEIARIDIFERPNETYPINKITFGDPIPGACDSIDSPNTDPPAGYGAIHILLGFTYSIPATPPTPPTHAVFQMEIGNINFEFLVGALNGTPALIPVKRYSNWTAVPIQDPAP